MSIKNCDGGPVLVYAWDGREFRDVQRAATDFASRMMACWSRTLNLLLQAKGILAESERYELRHGKLFVSNREVREFMIEVVYERYAEGRLVKSTPCAHLDMILKLWTDVQMAGGGFCEPDSPSWKVVKPILGEIIRAVPWIEGPGRGY